MPIARVRLHSELLWREGGDHLETKKHAGMVRTLPLHPQRKVITIIFYLIKNTTTSISSNLLISFEVKTHILPKSSKPALAHSNNWHKGPIFTKVDVLISKNASPWTVPSSSIEDYRFVIFLHKHYPRNFWAYPINWVSSFSIKTPFEPVGHVWTGM